MTKQDFDAHCIDCYYDYYTLDTSKDIALLKVLSVLSSLIGEGVL